MKNFGFYLDEKNNLVFSKIINYKIYDEYTIGKNEGIIKNVKNLSKCEIEDIYEHSNQEDITIKYKKFSVYIFDYKKVLLRKEMSNLLKSIKKYEEFLEINETPKKRVTRKNKYSKSKIILSGLSLTIFIGAFLAANMHVSADEISKVKYSYLSENKYSMVDSNSDDLFIQDDDFENIDKYLSDNKIIANNDDQIINNEIEEKIIYIDYEDRSETEKAITTKTLYGEIIEKYAKMYGLDPLLVIGIATQERGVHSTTMDRGGATGLMQIQNSVWENGNLSAYNYETGTMENIVVDVNRISELDYNIKIGCMILQSNMEYMNYNTFAAVQCYNMGYGNVRKILTQYSFDTGKSIDEILNSNDLGWLEYRDMITVGDQRYLENVLSWIGPSFEINTCMKDGTIINTSISCVENVKKVNN